MLYLCQLILGIPTYGRSFTVATGGDMKPPISPSLGVGTAGPITGEPGNLGSYCFNYRLKDCINAINFYLLNFDLS